MCFFPFPALVFPKNREIPGNSREVIFENSQTGTTLQINKYFHTGSFIPDDLFTSIIKDIYCMIKFNQNFSRNRCLFYHIYHDEILNFDCILCHFYEAFIDNFNCIIMSIDCHTILFKSHSNLSRLKPTKTGSPHSPCSIKIGPH